uniref:serine/threonine-protein kinase TIO-like n=1 Tax=Erigeron canadensis TaxID=72917 RepID=UPI001CB925FB|nr:serine/threonine-protein kinase TIO-like [Erigeron canadensis]
MYNKSVADPLCHLTSSSHTEVVSRGGDGTIVALIFDILHSYAGDLETVLTNEIDYPVDLIISGFLALTRIAQSFLHLDKTSAESILTSSRREQHSRLFFLVRLSDKCISVFEPYVMLLLASIFSLENRKTSSISEIALSIIPNSTELCSNLKDVIESKSSTLQASMDGTVGLLLARLKWDEDLTIEQFGSGVLETLVDLVGGNTPSLDNQIELSPIGVYWIVTLLDCCYKECNGNFFNSKKYIKFMSGLISDVYLEGMKRCDGIGGCNDVGFTVVAVSELLISPFEEPKDAYWMQIYNECLLEVGIPGQVVKCLGHVELENAATLPFVETLVSLLARMTHHRSVIAQIIDKGLFHPITTKRLRDTPLTREVRLNILKIISNIAPTDKEVYYEEQIEEAAILPFLPLFLTHENPRVRMQFCSTVCCMCVHNNYFYGLLEKHEIVPHLLACYFDLATSTRGDSIAALALHSDSLHEEVGRCIPQLTKSRLSAEGWYITNSIAHCRLRILVRECTKFCKDSISNGAMEFSYQKQLWKWRVRVRKMNR